MILLLATGCDLARAPREEPAAASMPLVEEARALIGLDRAALLGRAGVSPDALHPGTYGPTAYAESLEAPEPMVGRVFLDDGAVVLVLLYRGLVPSPGRTLFDGLKPDALHAAHPSPAPLRSRSG